MRGLVIISTFLLIAIPDRGQAKPQFGNVLVRCKKDPILKALEDFFDKKSYIKNQVACLTNLELKECQPNQFCDSCCCDAVGMRLRQLAPLVINDPDESNCPNRECICLKRDGRRVLDRLSRGRSKDGFSYKPFHDQVLNFYKQN